MQWKSAISTQENPEGAVSDCIRQLREALGDTPPDLLMLFVGGGHINEFEAIVNWAELECEPKTLVATSAGGVIGAEQEIEGQYAISAIGAKLPGVRVKGFIYDTNDMERLDADTLIADMGIEDRDQPVFLIIPDGFTFDCESFLQRMDWAFPKAVKLGGYASGGRAPGQNKLCLNGKVRNQGTIGLALWGNIRARSLVAQGCRPIGQPMFITKCQKNILFELNNQPIRDVLQELFQGLSEDEQRLFRQELFLGIEMKPKEEAYQQGDFLIRNILGFDQQMSGMSVGALLEETSVVQFHLRDATTSTQDLENCLERYRKENPKDLNPAGALLFSCLGRGSYLYGAPNHDSNLFQAKMGSVPLAGFFCNGEIGPVSGQTFVHGYTSCFGLFFPK